MHHRPNVIAPWSEGVTVKDFYPVFTLLLYAECVCGYLALFTYHTLKLKHKISNLPLSYRCFGLQA